MKGYLVLQLSTKATNMLGQSFNLENKESGVIGVCPVFSNKVKAKKEFPNATIVKIEGVKRI